MMAVVQVLIGTMVKHLFSADFGNTTGDSFSYESGPFVGTVKFTLYSDQDAAYLAFQNGEVDFVLNPLGVKRNLFNQLQLFQVLS